MNGWTWAPVGWFVPVVGVVVLTSIVLIARGWGKSRWLISPMLANVVLLFIALNQFTLAQDALIAEFANRGEWPPPVARIYLYVGALAFIPLIMGVIRAALYVRRARQADAATAST